MKNQTKRIFSTAAVCLFMVAAAALSGCHKDMKDDIDDLKNSVTELQKEVSTVKELAETLQEAIDAGLMISGAPEAITEGNKTGYRIKFTDGTSINVWNGTNGTDGEPGQDGDTLIKSINEDEENGTLVITLNSDPEVVYTIPMNYIYPTSVVVTSTYIKVGEGKTTTIKFRVNPSEAVIKESDVQLDFISDVETRAFNVTAPKNFELVAGTFKADTDHIGEYSIDVKCLKAENGINAAFVIDTKDSQNNPMQITSGIFEIGILSNVFTPNSLNPIKAQSVFSSETATFDLTFSWNGKDDLAAAETKVIPVNPADASNLVITSLAKGQFTVALNQSAQQELTTYPYSVNLTVNVTKGQVTSTQNTTITFKSNTYRVPLTQAPAWILIPIGNVDLYPQADIKAQIMTAFGDNVTAAQVNGAQFAAGATKVEFKANQAAVYGDGAGKGVAATATPVAPSNAKINYKVTGTNATGKGYYRVTTPVTFTLEGAAQTKLTVNVVSEYEVNDNKPFEITAPLIVDDIYTLNVLAPDTKMTLADILEATGDVDAATVMVNGKEVDPADADITFEVSNNATTPVWAAATEIIQPGDAKDFAKQFDVRAIVTYNGTEYKGEQVTINGGDDAFKAQFQRNLLTKVGWRNSATTFAYSTTGSAKTYDIAELIGFQFENTDPALWATYKESVTDNSWLKPFAAANIVFDDENIEGKCKEVNGTVVGLSFAKYTPVADVTTTATITFTDVFGTKKTFTVDVTITKPAE